MENIRLKLAKVRQARLSWHGHTLRLDEGNNVKQMKRMKVRGTRAKGRSIMRWMDNIRHDMNKRGLRETPKTGKQMEADGAEP